MTIPAHLTNLFRRFYGEMPPMNISRFSAYAKAIKIIASADGEFSAAEWDGLESLGRQLGATDSILDEISAYEADQGALEGLLAVYDPIAARAVLYDAIRIASADGYNARERAAVHRAARVLRVDETVVATIESIVELETAISRMKQRVFFNRP
jgi:tellurite resistance protein